METEISSALRELADAIRTTINVMPYPALTEALFNADATLAKEAATPPLSAALPHLGAAGVRVRETMWGEVVDDDYEGVSFQLCEEGNRDGHHFLKEITLAANTFPVGTKISIREPSALVPSPVPQEATAEPVAAEPLIAEFERMRDKHSTPSGTQYEEGQWDMAQRLIGIARKFSSPPSHDAELLAALRDLRQAVCGETGFASAVREHSGLAYPWPALDIAEAKADAVLSRAARAALEAKP